MNREWIYQEQSEKPEAFSGYVLGDEGCIYRALQTLKFEALIHEIAPGLCIRILTPFVPSNHMELLYQQIRKFSAHRKLKVTFNDYGFLYKCSELIEKDLIIPVLGRTLTQSLSDCTWTEELLSNEVVGAALAGNKFFHKQKKDLLESYGINELELNLNSRLSHFAELKSLGYHLTVNIADKLMSVGRVCYFSKYYDLDVEACMHNPHCTHNLEISLQQKWSRRGTLNAATDQQVIDMFDDHYIQGNMVMSHIKVIPVNQYIDTVIFY